MRYLPTYFWLSSAIFTINQLVERMGYPIPWVHSYLDDVMCPGIVLGFALFIQQQFTFRHANYQFGWGQTGFFVLWYSLLFEVLFPLWDSRHYSDPWDVLAYSLGAVLFMRYGNRGTLRLIQIPRLFLKGPRPF